MLSKLAVVSRIVRLNPAENKNSGFVTIVQILLTAGNNTLR